MSHGSPRFSIGELADCSGTSRRSIRFYVQRGLLQPPLGLGRGRHYGSEHHARLQEIQKLQAAGHSLDAIKRILDGDLAPAAEKARAYTARVARGMAVELWTKIHLADGAELQLDTAKHPLNVDQLLAIQQSVAEILRRTSNDGANARQKGEQA
jgi:DNA-binding transcriptional MerR regulator